MRLGGLVLLIGLIGASTYACGGDDSANNSVDDGAEGGIAGASVSAGAGGAGGSGGTAGVGGGSDASVSGGVGGASDANVSGGGGGVGGVGISDDAGDASAEGGPTLGPIVHINEVVPDDANGGADWVELTNVGDQAADISGWYFTDNDVTNVYTFPSGTVIQPGAYLTLDQNASGSFTFGLGASGDTVNLYSSMDTLVDSTSWTGSEAIAPNSWGRFPDGTGVFATRTIVTKGAANQ